MSSELLRKIAALEAQAASTTFPAEAETARRLAAKLREALPPDDTVEDEEAREWRRTMDAAESNRIISAMVSRAYSWLCGKGCQIYRDGPQFVVVRGDAIEPATAGDILNMAVAVGFKP